MSSYYDDRDDRRDDRRRDRDRGGGRDRRDRDRDRDRDQGAVYEEEEIIEARRRPAKSDRSDDRGDPRGASRGGELVRRRRDDSSSAEEVERDFPPGGGAYVRRRKEKDRGPPRRARSHGGGRYDDDSYDDLPRKKDKRRDRRRDYSSSSYSSSPEPRRKPERRKSLGEQALAALGIGAAAGAAADKHGRDRDRDRDRSRRSTRRRRDSSYSSDSRSRSRGGRNRGGGDQKEQLIKAARAALTAGAVEAFRSRKEPGGWAGPKGRRVLTAAVGAGGIDGLLNSGKKDGQGGGALDGIQAVIGGLAGNRLINGSRDKDGSRSRSRSRGGREDKGGGGGGLAALGAGGLAAAAGKMFMDRNKSTDRGGDRRRYSSDDDDRRGGRGKRSKSVSDYARQGMAAIGIGGDKGGDNRGSRRGYDDDSPPRGYQSRPRGGGGEGGDGIRSLPGSQSSSDDDESSSDEEKERKKMGHKQLITAGLASVATIHAAQSVYKSIEGRAERKKEVAKGEMSPQEARKKKNKARMQDAAAIGIAALGIKGAYSEWKEMKEQRDEVHEFDLKRAERHARREQRQLDEKKYGVEHVHGHHEAYSVSSPDLHSQATPAYPPSPYSPGPASDYASGAGYYGESNGPHYSDGNPYASGGLPPPPMGPH